MKSRMLCILVLLMAASAGADEYAQFRSLVDFDSTVFDLCDNPGSLDKKRLYLLEGIISNLNIQYPEPERYYTEAEFLSARWNGTTELETRKIWLVFAKAEYADRIPSRPGRPVKGSPILNNKRGLALVQYMDTITLDDGTIAHVFQVHDYRALDS